MLVKNNDIRLHIWIIMHFWLLYECQGLAGGNLREGDHWGDLGVDEWIILGWISRRWDVGI